MMKHDFETLLAPQGHMREFIRTAPGGGEWVDDLCDELLLALTVDHLEDLTLKYGAMNANVNTSSKGVQLSIKWESGGWQVHIARTFQEAMQKMWQQQHMVNQQRENDNGQTT